MHSDPYDPSEVASRCCWCGKSIAENTPLYALGARTKPGVDVSQYEGGAMPIKLVAQEKLIYAVVPGADSQARRHGRDLMFVVCSKGCGTELKLFLQNEIVLGNMLEGIDEM